MTSSGPSFPCYGNRSLSRIHLFLRLQPSAAHLAASRRLSSSRTIAQVSRSQ